MIDDAIRDAYARHVERLCLAYDACLAANGWDAVVIHSGSARKRTEFDDQYWPVRPVPHFQHWAALAEPDALLVVRPAHRPALYRIDRFDFWEHPYAPESDHFLSHFDVRGVSSIEEARSSLPTGRVAIVCDDLSRAALLGFTPEALNPPGLVGALDALRTRKTEYEILCIAEANRRAARGHDAVLRAFAGGAGVELSLHLAYLDATSQDDPDTPYKNIVALGAHAATLHHVSYAKGASGPTQRGAAESLLLDAGATCLGYCSDITRTWVRGSGATADAFRGIVAGMEAMQQKLCAAVRAGDGYESLHDRSHEGLGVILREAGVVKVSGAEAVAKGITRAFYPHGLGHSLGLQCHDVGCALTKPREDNPFLRNTSVIAEGQVFTIEPGVYFIDGLLRPLREGPDAAAVDWALVDALSPFGGIRIEDDLVVRGEGAGNIRNLTREHLPRGGGEA
ncbi:MAG: Xaa-Pro dipeptidase [Polyangiales bacterium]